MIAIDTNSSERWTMSIGVSIKAIHGQSGVFIFPPPL